jgi:hypothetical protein
MLPPEGRPEMPPDGPTGDTGTAVASGGAGGRDTVRAALQLGVRWRSKLGKKNPLTRRFLASLSSGIVPRRRALPMALRGGGGVRS